jgi:hypothetical protein
VAVGKSKRQDRFACEVGHRDRESDFDILETVQHGDRELAVV